MCLDKLVEPESPENILQEAMLAFKVVYRNASLEKKDPEYRPVYKFLKEWLSGRRAERVFARIGGGWGLNEDRWETTLSGQSYIPGVHAYPHLVDASDEEAELSPPFPLSGYDPGPVVVQILLRGPICRGTQDGRPVVVYREMTILRELRKNHLGQFDLTPIDGESQDGRTEPENR